MNTPEDWLPEDESSEDDLEPLDRVRTGATTVGGTVGQYVAHHKTLLKKHGPEFDKPIRTFSINIAEAAVIDAWVESLKPEIMALQGKKFDTISPNEPYYGAAGGGLTYSFIPTSLGDILVAKETITGKELNVSDALDWFFYG